MKNVKIKYEYLKLLYNERKEMNDQDFSFKLRESLIIRDENVKPKEKIKKLRELEYEYAKAWKALISEHAAIKIKFKEKNAYFLLDLEEVFF